MAECQERSGVPRHAMPLVPPRTETPILGAVARWLGHHPGPMGHGGDRALERDPHVRALLSAGDVDGAATFLLRDLGPEVFGFLRGSLVNEADADEVFS